VYESSLETVGNALLVQVRVWHKSSFVSVDRKQKHNYFSFLSFLMSSFKSITAFKLVLKLTELTVKGETAAGYNKSTGSPRSGGIPGTVHETIDAGGRGGGTWQQGRGE
jgi:hypothetical protein